MSSPPETLSEADSGSLAILLADRGMTKTETSNHKSTNTQLIEKLAAQLIGRIADHDFDHPDIPYYLVDDYVAFLEYQSELPIIKSRDSFLESFRAFGAANPGYRLELASIYADVNEKNGTAAVWMLLNVTGHPEGVRRESVTLQIWKRKEGRWRAYKQTGIRGVGGYI